MSRSGLALTVTSIVLLLSTLSYGEDSFLFTSDRIMQAIPSDSGAFFEAHLVNTGNRRDTYTVVKLENIPEGWFSVFCLDSVCLFDSGQVSLGPGEIALVEPDMFPRLVPGDGEVAILVTSANNPDSVKKPAFHAVSGYRTLLINHVMGEDPYRS